MCHIHADYKSIDSALNPYFTFFDAGVGILQSIVLCHVDSSYAFSAQALEADWGGRMKTEGTCWFQFACCSYQSHPMHVASPWLQQWFPTYSIILLFASHLHHPPLPYPTPQGVKGLPGLVPGLVTSYQDYWLFKSSPLNKCGITSTRVSSPPQLWLCGTLISVPKY